MNPGRDNCFWRNEWFFKVSMNANPPHEPTQRFGADKDEKRTGKTSLSVPNLWASLLSGSGAQGANRVFGNSHPGPLPQGEGAWSSVCQQCGRFMSSCGGWRNWRNCGAGNRDTATIHLDALNIVRWPSDESQG